jgi:hypothetical protein
MMLGLPFLPQSSRWLAKVDRSEEAILTLARIQAKGNIDDPLVVAESEEITTVLAAERSAARAGGKSFSTACGVGLWLDLRCKPGNSSQERT